MPPGGSRAAGGLAKKVRRSDERGQDRRWQTGRCWQKAFPVFFFALVRVPAPLSHMPWNRRTEGTGNDAASRVPSGWFPVRENHI